MVCFASLSAILVGDVAESDSFGRILSGNDAIALSQWGRRYEHGEGVVKDVDRAIRLYCRAARLGHATAHYHLGWIYAIGRAGSKDDDLAAAWFYLASEKHDPHAKRMLNRLGYTNRPRRKPVCLLSDGTTFVEGVRYAEFLGSADRAPIARLVEKLAPTYGLSPDLVLAVIEVESNFDPLARSPKNAKGLMQLIPSTAERFGVVDIWDPEQNLRGGMAYLRWLLKHFNGDLELALAAYNAGEGAVKRHGGVPPYTETRQYVRRITAKLGP